MSSGARKIASASSVPQVTCITLEQAIVRWDAACVFVRVLVRCLVGR